MQELITVRCESCGQVWDVTYDDIDNDIIYCYNCDAVPKAIQLKKEI